MAPTPLTPNQLIAYNLRKARELRGLTQEQAADRLEPYLGVRWSKATFSAAERSVDGDRIREFTADEIVAFARAFNLPVTYFLLPPQEDVRVVSSAAEPLGKGEYLQLTFTITRDLMRRLVELHSVLRGKDLTESQAMIRDLVMAEATAEMRAVLGHLTFSTQELRMLANLLDAVVPKVEDKLGPELLRRVMEQARSEAAGSEEGEVR